MRRDLTLSGYYAGSLYVESAAWIGLEASQIKRRDKVYFSVAPYERNHRNRDYTAAGETGGCSLSPYYLHNGQALNDYELWNQAAAILQQESDRVTIRYNSPRGSFPARSLAVRIRWKQWQGYSVEQLSDYFPRPTSIES
jgi:hypothetical protein